METALKNEIKKLSKRILSRSASADAKDLEYRNKFTKRTGITAGVPKKAPKKPPITPLFDPKHCARNANFLAKTIWRKVLSKNYKPIAAQNFLIPKPAGGYRSIMAFSIPDAALANVMMKRSRERNLKRLSSFSYAYNPQKNIFDAVLALSNYITTDKLFAVQIDFEKYFDSIPSRYLKACIADKNMLSLTPHEKYVFGEFLHHQYADSIQYKLGNFKRRVIGTPQGSSISLLLANLACDSLDRSLEKCAGKFVRYADDVTAVCANYEDAQKVENCFIEHCKKSGIKINEAKSEGVAIISKHKSEMRNYESLKYLGYSFSKDGTSIPESVIRRIKSKLSRLIHIYLIHYPLYHGFSNKRNGVNPDFDWDLLGLLSEIRKYLYGGLDEKDIQLYLDEGKKLRQMRGLMGFYALIERREQFVALDGWLANSIKRAMHKRTIILNKKYGVQSIQPSEKHLILGTWLDLSAWRGKRNPEAKLPSFVRGWRAARKYYFTFGLEKVEPPNYISYY
ncbi:MAG: hypothetical protein H6627_15040 [Calditrichae bacterium]|nr:hypothetical protein [Calditrichia bacterium]